MTEFPNPADMHQAVPGKLPNLAKTPMPLTSELRALLEKTGPDAAAGVTTILRRPDLVKQTLAALPELIEVAEAKAGPKGVVWVMSRRFEVYPQPQRSESQWETWWTSYFDVLKDVPLCKLEAGMIAFMASEKAEFMPKPGQLFQAAMAAQPIELSRWYIAKQVERGVKAGDATRIMPEKRDVLEPPTEAEKARVKGMLAEFVEQMADRNPKPPPVELPNTAGPVDQGGLTPEMRAVLQREFGTDRPFRPPGMSDSDATARNAFE